MAVDLVKKGGGALLVEVVLHPLHAEQKLVRQIFNSVLSRALNLKVQGDPRMHLISLLQWLSQPSLPGMGCVCTERQVLFAGDRCGRELLGLPLAGLHSDHDIVPSELWVFQPPAP